MIGYYFGSDDKIPWMAGIPFYWSRYPKGLLPDTGTGKTVHSRICPLSDEVQGEEETSIQGHASSGKKQGRMSQLHRSRHPIRIVQGGEGQSHLLSAGQTYENRSYHR